MPPCGIENGLCENSMRPVSSFRSYIGKSTVQQKRNTSCSNSSNSAQMRVRYSSPTLLFCDLFILFLRFFTHFQRIFPFFFHFLGMLPK